MLDERVKVSVPVAGIGNFSLRNQDHRWLYRGPLRLHVYGQLPHTW